MKALYFTLIASAVLLASSIAKADECPPGQGMMGHGMGMMGRGMGMGQGMGRGGQMMPWCPYADEMQDEGPDGQ